MTNAPIRIVVLLGAICLAGIVATQAYWASRAIDSQEKQFSHSVQIALRSVVESLCEIQGEDFPSHDPIEQVSSNYFIVKTRNKIDLSSLEYLLKAELEKRAINQDFEYGVYDCQSDKMVYGDLVTFNAEKKTKVKSQLPQLSQYDTHFGILFPMTDNNPLWGLDWWKFTTGLTLAVLVFFGYAMFVILRQKRLSVIQRDFVNNITHEFKTPLATLKVASSVLSVPDNLKNPERTSRYAEVIQAETSRLEKHVNQLLNHAFIEHKNHAELVSIDASKLIHEIVNRFDPKSKNVDVKFRCDETVQVRANHYLLQTAIYNLIDNALKYGGGLLEICVEESSGKGIISISDNGKGIPKEQTQKIFKKFYRISEGDQHNVKGFGLGLYVVKNAMERMNGEISLTSSDKTTFKLSLPKA